MGKVRVENQTEPTTPTTGHTDIYVDSTTKKLTSKDDAGNVINYGLLSEGQIANALTMNSTTVIDGCAVSINAGDSGKIDIASGTYMIVDAHTDPTQPDVTLYTFPGATGVVPTTLATNPASYVFLDSSLNPHFTEIIDPSDKSTFRDYAYLATISHPDNVTIIEANNSACGSPINLSAALCDYLTSVGFVNAFNGNVYSGIASSLQVFKSAGYLFAYGLNYNNNKKNPHIFATGESSPVALVYNYRDGTGDYIFAPATTTAIPNKYDDGTVATSPNPNGSVGSDEWTVQRLYLTISTTLVSYGQAKYQTKADAIASINSDVIDEPASLYASTFRGWLVVRGGATDLDDVNDAEFFEADKFGTRLNNGGIPNSVTTMQKAYENGMEPEITLNSTRGAVSIQDADTPIGADLFEVLRSGGTEATFKVDTSRMVSPAPASAPADGDLDTSTVALYQDETNDYLRAKVKQSDDSVHSFILSAGQPDSYGEMYEQGLSSVITVSTAGTYYGWTTALTGLVAGTGFVTFNDNSTADRLTIGTDGGGIYRVDCFVSFSGSNSATVEGAIYKTGSREDKISFTRKLGVGGDVGTAACSGLLSLASGDYVDLRFTSDSNGDTIVIENLNVSITRV